jgi:hypothetical protein
MSDENQSGADASTQPPPAKPRRWLKWALVASLAFNVLFVGFAASRAYHHHSGKFWRGNSQVSQVMREGRKFVKDLPRERRRELIDMIKPRLEEFHIDDVEVKAAVQIFAEALQEEPYNETRAEEALVKVQEQAQLAITSGRGVFLYLIGQLSKEEREKLAARLLTKSDE